MHIETVWRKQEKIRLALTGTSGSGKTYSALILAYGLIGDWNKIALIDTEDGSASLYSHLGPFTTVSLGAPYYPSRYYEALDLCIDSGKDVIIIDSLSPEWTGEGGIMDRQHGKDHAQATREHRYLMSLITSCNAHVICTMRTRKRILLTEDSDGKRVKQLFEIPQQQQGIEYPFTTVLRLDSKQRAQVVKDRTGIFTGKAPAQLESDHGLFLANWCNRGEPTIPEDLQQLIDACTTQQELQTLMFSANVEPDQVIAFTRRRLELDGDYPLNAA